MLCWILGHDRGRIEHAHSAVASAGGLHVFPNSPTATVRFRAVCKRCGVVYEGEKYYREDILFLDAVRAGRFHEKTKV